MAREGVIGSGSKGCLRRKTETSNPGDLAKESSKTSSYFVTEEHDGGRTIAPRLSTRYGPFSPPSCLQDGERKRGKIKGKHGGEKERNGPGREPFGAI